MSEYAWVTQAPSDERLMKPIWSEALLNDGKAALELERPIMNKNRRGVPLPASDFPKRVRPNVTSGMPSFDFHVRRGNDTPARFPNRRQGYCRVVLRSTVW